MNKGILVGRLTKDPELKHTSNNVAVCNFTLAVNRSYKRDGEPDADFINCVVWKAQAENLVKYIKKGGLIGVDGRIEIGSYEHKQGHEVPTFTIICSNVTFLEPKTKDDDGLGF